jgi:hypothetical protein
MEIQVFLGRDFTNEDSRLVRPVPAGMLASMVGVKGSKDETSLKRLYASGWRLRDVVVTALPPEHTFFMERPAAVIDRQPVASGRS